MRQRKILAISSANTYDRTTQDVGNIVLFEHLNLKVPDFDTAIRFYVEGLGLTRDPTWSARLTCGSITDTSSCIFKKGRHSVSAAKSFWLFRICSMSPIILKRSSRIYPAAAFHGLKKAIASLLAARGVTAIAFISSGKVLISPEESPICRQIFPAMRGRRLPDSIAACWMPELKLLQKMPLK